MHSNIPKVIWQTHEWAYEDLPENFKKVAMTWKNLNPGWDYRYVSAADRAAQVKANNELLYLFYRAMDKVSQADVWRYVTVLENGGFYADMDSMCIMPLDSVLDKVPNGIELIATGQDHDGSVNNANFGAIKNSYILSEIVRNIIRLFQTMPLVSLLELTEEGMSLTEAVQYQLKLGPSMYFTVLHPNLDSVWLGYDQGVIHSKDISNLTWNPNHVINYYGKSISYMELALREGWSII